jgi:predicted nucleic acid-binding protein
MRKVVVVDASLAVAWAVPERYSQHALRLAGRWARRGTRLFAPCLLLPEVTNALYKRIVRGELNLDTAQAALRIVLGFAIEIREEPGLQARAMALAHRLGRPSAYDCQYLALAEHHRCEFWTGDQRFFNAVKRTVPRVKWIGNVPSPPIPA